MPSGVRHNENMLDIPVGPVMAVVRAVIEQSVPLQLTSERLGSGSSRAMRIV